MNRLFALEATPVKILVIAPLLMIVMATVYQQNTSHAVESQRHHGLVLANAISEVIADSSDQQIDDVMLHNLIAQSVETQPAYAAWLSPQGLVIAQTGSHKADQVNRQFPSDPFHWFGENPAKTADGQYIEYRAPVIRQDQLKGFVVVAYATTLWPWQTQVSATMLSSLLVIVVVFALITSRNARQAGTDSPQKAETDIVTSDKDIETVEHAPTGTVISSRFLQRQKQQLDTMLNAMPNAVIRLNSRREVSYANKKVFDMFNVQPGTLLGSRVEQWCASAEIRDVLTLEQILTDTKCHHRRFDITDYCNATTGANIAMEICPLAASAQRKHRQHKHDQSGADEVLVLFHDNSAQRNEKHAVADFIAHVAHQIKTPLNTIYMYSEVLIDAIMGQTQQAARAASVINRETLRMAKLIDNLNNISMLDSGSICLDCQPVEINHYLTTLVDSLRQAHVSRANDIKCGVADQEIHMKIDRKLMQLAIEQLLVNAIQYSKPGETVHVSIEQKAYRCRIRVSDTGIGIGDIDKYHIFDMFYRSEDPCVRETQGNGLGLTLARCIVEKHGAVLECESVPARGSRFSITLPLDHPEMTDNSHSCKSVELR